MYALTPPEERKDWEPAKIKLMNKVPSELEQALNINQGYTYAKFVRYKDFYLFADFTYNSSMGRVAVIKGTTLIGEIIGKPGRELIGQSSIFWATPLDWS